MTTPTAPTEQGAPRASMRRYVLYVGGLVAGALLVSGALLAARWAQVPDVVASHWGRDGVDATQSKAGNLALLWGLVVGLAVLFAVLARFIHPDGRRYLAAATGFTTGLVTVIVTGSMLAQVGLTDPYAASIPGVVTALAVVVSLVAGTLLWWLNPPPPVTAPSYQRRSAGRRAGRRPRARRASGLGRAHRAPALGRHARPRSRAPGRCSRVVARLAVAGAAAGGGRRAGGLDAQRQGRRQRCRRTGVIGADTVDLVAIGSDPVRRRGRGLAGAEYGGYALRSRGSGAGSSPGPDRLFGCTSPTAARPRSPSTTPSTPRPSSTRWSSRRQSARKTAVGGSCATTGSR